MKWRACRLVGLLLGNNSQDASAGEGIFGQFIAWLVALTQRRTGTRRPAFTALRRCDRVAAERRRFAGRATDNSAVAFAGRVQNSARVIDYSIVLKWR
jgi:hypothetical protein